MEVEERQSMMMTVEWEGQWVEPLTEEEEWLSMMAAEWEGPGGWWGGKRKRRTRCLLLEELAWRALGCR